jgi:hypothetical protein
MAGPFTRDIGRYESFLESTPSSEWNILSSEIESSLVSRGGDSYNQVLLLPF